VWPIRGLPEFEALLEKQARGVRPWTALCCGLLYTPTDLGGRLTDYVRRQFGILDRMTGESVALFCFTRNVGRDDGGVYDVARFLEAHVDALPCAIFFENTGGPSAEPSLPTLTVLLRQFFSAAPDDEDFERGFRAIGTACDAAAAAAVNRLTVLREELVRAHGRAFHGGALSTPGDTKPSGLETASSFAGFAGSALDLVGAILRLVSGG
jgi:hypothetical protein